MSGVVKFEINELLETLKKLLKSSITAEKKERLQNIYQLKTKSRNSKRNCNNVRVQSSNTKKMVS